MATEFMLRVHWRALADDMRIHLDWLERGELDAAADDVGSLRRKIDAFDDLMRLGHD